jgi:pyridoxine/pyridoxamine 5'-phosphate oxidase
MIHPEKTPKENLDELLKYLKRGAADPKFPFRYTTLTTTKPASGVPTARMLVLRSVDDEGHFVFFSDRRSEKVSELGQNPQAHLMFWHPRQQVQIGIHASVQIHQQDTLSNGYMKQVSEHGKQQYTSLRSPSTPLDTPAEGLEHNPQLFEDNFCALRAAPWRITALQLRREGHLRLRFEKSGNLWEGGWITP